MHKYATVQEFRLQMYMKFICINGLKLSCTSLLHYWLSDDLVELSRQLGGIKINVVSSYCKKEKPS